MIPVHNLPQSPPSTNNHQLHCTTYIKCESCNTDELHNDYCLLNSYKQATVCIDNNTQHTNTTYIPCNDLNNITNSVDTYNINFIFYIVMLLIICISTFAGMSYRKQLINRIQNHRIDRMVNS